MPYLFIILAFAVSVQLASMIIPRILLISARKRLFDEPSKRKVHTKAVPRLGGVSFFPTILFTCCFIMSIRFIFGVSIRPDLASFLIREFLLLVCGMTLLYIVGIADDLVGVRYRQKFAIQILCASFLPISGLWINNFNGLFGLYDIPAFAGVPFTIFIVVFIINAINLIDGIDGLASGLSSVALIVMGILFMHKELWTYSMLAFATVGVLVPFFYHNVFGNADRARKIFMGDTGSLTLGYILSFLAVKFCMYNPGMIPYTDGAIVIIFSTLLLPVLDVIRVVLLRLRKGKNPFEPDKNHIHHKFLDMGFSPRRTMFLLIFIAVCFSTLNITLRPYLENNILVLIDVLLWIGLNMWWDKVRDKRLAALKSNPPKGK